MTNKRIKRSKVTIQHHHHQETKNKIEKSPLSEAIELNFRYIKNRMEVKQNGGCNVMMILGMMMKLMFGQVMTTIIHTIQIQHILLQSKH